MPMQQTATTDTSMADESMHLATLSLRSQQVTKSDGKQGSQ